MNGGVKVVDGLSNHLATLLTLPQKKSSRFKSMERNKFRRAVIDQKQESAFRSH